MWIEVDLSNHLDVAESIANCLAENGFINKGFRIECTLFAPPDGLWVRRATIYFNDWIGLSKLRK